MGGVDYRVLGSLEAIREGKQLPLGGAKQRAVLAILLMAANRVVTSDELIEALWPQSPPGKPQTAIQGYVSQLRKVLAPDRPFDVIVTEPAGYRMPVDRDSFDLFRLEMLLRRGRDALEADRAGDASSAFGEALALFRGPPLADFTYESWAQSEIGRLSELRLVCLEERIETDLRLGRHGELVGELESLVVDHPLRERLRGQLMVALYRAGRQSEALAAYQDARRVLVEEFGIEPNRSLQELERKVLLQDPALDLEPVVRETSQAGTLTLLFTDIEDSTRLVHRLGDEYAHVLVEHRRLLREAFEGKSGRIVDSYGDCFFVTFERAIDAAAAAAAAQRALTGYPWPGHVPLKVRMGLHTGEPVAVGDGFVGLDVHRAARICDAAHGGQVLLSAAAADALESELDSELSVRELGEHRLKDLPQEERLFQLVASGVADQFPPPRSEREPKVAPSERSILVIPAAGDGARDLVDIAASLTRSHIPHELIVARLVDARSRDPAGLATALTSATSELQQARALLAERGVDVRVAAFTSAAAGEDIVRLATEQAVDLVLVERPPEDLTGEKLDPELAEVLSDAPCDVAACFLRDMAPADDGQGLVSVPFGGGAHDWAALELGAWLASSGDLRLRLLGVAGDPQAGRRDASRLLAAASLAVQQLVGVATEPALLPAGVEGLLEASRDGAMLVAGVPEDWRERGLGSVRATLAAKSPITTFFVRRGIRPGGLAPSERQTRFTWSLAEVGSASRG